MIVEISLLVMFKQLKNIGHFFFGTIRCLIRIFPDSTINDANYILAQIMNINHLKRVIHKNLRMITMGQTMTKGCHHGIVLRSSKGAEYIGNDHPGEPSSCPVRPVLEDSPALPFGCGIQIVLPLL